MLIGCADQSGIVAAVSGFLFGQGGNIVSSHQYSSDASGGRFFMRTEVVLESHVDHGGFQASFEAEVARRFAMDWRIRWWGERRRVAILVSRQDHCLQDLLWRWRRGELDAEIVAVISNHRDLEEEAIAAGVAFHHVPVEQGRKVRAEGEMLELLEGNAELLVLARYMQILSGDFLERVGMPAIDIHHSFLPAFAGADPYGRARERGVKLLGRPPTTSPSSSTADRSSTRTSCASIIARALATSSASGATSSDWCSRGPCRCISTIA